MHDPTLNLLLTALRRTHATYMTLLLGYMKRNVSRGCSISTLPRDVLDGVMAMIAIDKLDDTIISTHRFRKVTSPMATEHIMPAAAVTPNATTSSIANAYIVFDTSESSSSLSKPVIEGQYRWQFDSESGRRTIIFITKGLCMARECLYREERWYYRTHTDVIERSMLDAGRDTLVRRIEGTVDINFDMTLASTGSACRRSYRHLEKSSRSDRVHEFRWRSRFKVSSVSIGLHLEQKQRPLGPQRQQDARLPSTMALKLLITTSRNSSSWDFNVDVSSRSAVVQVCESMQLLSELMDTSRSMSPSTWSSIWTFISMQCDSTERADFLELLRDISATGALRR